MNIRPFIVAILSVVIASVAVGSATMAASTTPPTTSPVAKTPVATTPVTPVKTCDDGQKYRGTVTAVDATASTITIQLKKDAPQTFTVSSYTKIHVDKTIATLEDIQIGQVAVVCSKDGKAALKIYTHDKKARATKK